MAHYHPETNAQIKGIIRDGPTKITICAPCTDAAAAEYLKGDRKEPFRKIATMDIKAHDKVMHADDE